MKVIDWYWYCGKFVFRNKILKRLFHKQVWPSYGCIFLENREAAKQLRKMIFSDTPFMAARVGFNEMAMLKAFDFKKKDKYGIVTKNMCDMAGFFPNDINLGDRFSDYMKSAISSTDMLGLMNSPMEDYYVKRFMNSQSIVTPFSVFDFWTLQESWTEALKGKRVLVVHPFAKSIEKQYLKRDKLFLTHPEYLPEFTLITYQAVQTAGGNVDSRFQNWFEALEFMENEIRKIDFDIAIIGCGAYGFLLAEDIKKSGRQAIHMGGVSQLLFGIKGQRWTKKNSSALAMMNEDWVWPLDEEVPVDPERIEGGPYFRPTESYRKRIENSRNRI